MDERGDEELREPKALARLTIYSDDLVSAELASLVGRDPDECWDRGQPRVYRHRRPDGRLYTTTAIAFVSDVPDSDDPGEHLKELLDRIDPLVPAIRGLDGRDGVTVRLKVAYFDEPGNPTFSFSPATMVAAAALGVDLEFDLYVF